MKTIVQLPVTLSLIDRLMVDRVGGELVCHVVYHVTNEVDQWIGQHRGRKVTLDADQKIKLRAFVVSLLPEINAGEGTEE